MKSIRCILIWGTAALLALTVLSSVQAQSLQQELKSRFAEVLSRDNLYLGQFNHGEHFEPSSIEASGATIDAFSNFISANISSFPLSSTVSGITFDFSGGAPTTTTSSLGPIFAERAQTLGRNRLNVGFTFSYLDFAEIRGVNVEDLNFVFVHDDIGGPTGNDPSGVIGDDRFGTEFDTIELLLNTKFTASIFSFLMTYGITNRLDVGVAVPYVTVSMEGNPLARMVPRTSLSRQDTSTHFWGEPNDPQLTFSPTALKDDAVGIGDIALRIKYNFLRGGDVDLAALAEYRPPTGDAEDFLGAGEPSFKFQMIMSSVMGNFAPHLNIAYENRGSQLDRNEIEVYTGYDQKISDYLTLAIDFLGEFEIGEQSEALKFPEPVVLQGADSQFGNWSGFREEVPLTNIPNASNDHVMNGSFGFKLNPKENLLIIANVIVPLNEGGLRSNVIPTFGIEFTF